MFRKLCLLFLLCLSTVVFAAKTNVAAGTDILSTGTSVTLSYVVAGVTRNENSAVDASAIVSMNGGIHMDAWSWPGFPNTININAGDSQLLTTTLINDGNFTDTISANLVDKLGGFTGAWECELASSNIVLSRGGSMVFGVSVTVDPTAIDGDVGSFMVSLNGTTPGAFYKKYTGDNAYEYGESSTYNRIISFLVVAPDISITKSVIVAAPVNYIALGGGATDPVPGATLKYVLDYKNTGSGAANLIQIIDVIPENTEFASAETHGSITLDYSNDNMFTWGYVPTGTVDSTVTHVRWTVGSLPSGNTDQVTLNVVVK